MTIEKKIYSILNSSKELYSDDEIKEILEFLERIAELFVEE